MSSSSSSSPAAPPAAANFTAGFISQRKTSTTTNKKHPRIKRALATVWFAFSLVLVQLVTFNGRNWADYFHDTTIHDVMDESTRVNTRQLQLVETSPLSSNDTIAFPNNDSQISAVESTLLVEKSPVVCTGTEDGSHSHQQCCGTWDVDTDDWWTQKPDWEVTEENRTHFCYAPMKDRAQAAFLRHVHERQWTSNNCSLVEKSVEVNSGYGASVGWLAKAFWHAHMQDKPFQIAYTTRRWLYSTPSSNNASWAYCSSEDTQCYFLPISNCSREETIRGEHASAGTNGSREEKLQFLWLRQYMMRPKQHYRRKLFEHRQTLPMKYPCSTMHVRRGDAGFPRPPFRRYAGVYEYIDAANIQKGDNVFLMTDDESTILEVNKHLPDYNWIYLDRPRNDGVKGGFDGHIPSGDEGSEMLAIDTELRLAKTCEKLVYGHSGFMNGLVQELKLLHQTFTYHYVDTTVTKEEARKFGGQREARVESFLHDIEAAYERRAGTHLDPTATQENPLVCHNTSERLECCASWDVDADDWWLNKPDWQVSLENETSFCFSPIANETKAQLMRDVHERQWVTGNCSEREMSAEINSGFGAGMGWLRNSFWHAHVMKKPFQIAKSDWHWMYAPKNKSSWAYCEDEDITCYTLPISPCPRDGFRLEDRNFWKPKKQRAGEIRDALWLREYMLRPRQIFRRKAYEMRQTLQIQAPCTMMHVRRADSGLPHPPFRRYAAIQEYIDAANIQEGENILLLTDDQSSIDEAKKYHHKYNWTYLERPRNDGSSIRWEGHIPSGDGAYEMLAIDTELKVAATCNKIVHGYSGFMGSFMQKLVIDERQFESFYVDTTVTKAEAHAFHENPKARPAILLGAIESKLNETRKKEESEIGEDDEGDKGSNRNSIDSIHRTRLPEVSNPLECHTTSTGSMSCCGSWDTEADDWWLHQPDWAVTMENKTSYCLSPMQNEEKADFFRKTHKLQWLSNCSQAMTAWQINSGFGASTGWLAYAFLKANKEKKPFQLMAPQQPWLYGPKDNSSWAFCEERDISCYYLPISSCPRETVKQKRHWIHRERNRQGRLEFEWLKEYMLRPKQVMRRKLYEMRARLNVRHPCTTMHVRRGDAGFPRQPYRRYAAVQEYLDAAKVEEGANIMLLTDDESTLEEIQEHHPNYHWMYLDRPRTNGVEGGWQGHIPSGDGAFEILAIDTEFRLASGCERVVHGASGFMNHLLGKMDMEGKLYKKYFVKTGVSKEEAKRWPNDGKARLEYLQNEMEAYRQGSKEMKRKSNE